MLCGLRLMFSREAALVNVGRSYDVNHEALIRGWKRLLGLAEGRPAACGSAPQRRSENFRATAVRPEGWRLGAVLEARHGLDPRRKPPASGPDRRRRRAKTCKTFSVRTARSASNGRGRRWSGPTLRLPMSMPAHIPSKRALKVKKTIDDAILYRSGASESAAQDCDVRRRGHVGLRCRMTILFVIATRQQALNDRLAGLTPSCRAQPTVGELSKQFRFFRLQTEVIAARPNGTRNLVDDREVYAALQVGLDTVAESNVRTVIRGGAGGLWPVLSSRPVRRRPRSRSNRCIPYLDAPA